MNIDNLATEVLVYEKKRTIFWFTAFMVSSIMLIAIVFLRD